MVYDRIDRISQNVFYGYCALKVRIWTPTCLYVDVFIHNVYNMRVGCRSRGDLVIDCRHDGSRDARQWCPRAGRPQTRHNTRYLLVIARQLNKIEETDWTHSIFNSFKRVLIDSDNLSTIVFTAEVLFSTLSSR